MCKVLTDQEVVAERKKGNTGYNEQWVVEYTELNDEGFWEEKTASYNTASKGRHKEVEARWAKDLNGHTATIKKIRYC